MRSWTEFERFNWFAMCLSHDTKHLANIGHWRRNARKCRDRMRVVVQSCRRISVWPPCALPYSVATMSHRRSSTPAKSSQQRHSISSSVQQAANSSGKPAHAAAACRAAALQTCLRIAADGRRLVQILHSFSCRAARLRIARGSPCVQRQLSGSHCRLVCETRWRS